MLDDQCPPPPASDALRFDYTVRLDLDHLPDTTPRDAAITLCYLRNNDVANALRRCRKLPAEISSNLLIHLGFEEDLIRLGAWLRSRSISSESLCQRPTPRIAEALVSWSESHWGDWKVRRDMARHGKLLPGPTCPSLELLFLLEPDNGVPDATKRRLARLLNDRAEEARAPIGLWLERAPSGSEEWLVDLARKSLTVPRNDIRKQASLLLTNAGVHHEVPPVIEGPRYRIAINGVPWPGKRDTIVAPDPERSRLSIRVGSLSPGRSSYWSSQLRTIGKQSSLFEADPDPFHQREALNFARLNYVPDAYRMPAPDPNDPWLSHPIDLPPKLGKTVNLDLRTFALTVLPDWLDKPKQERDADIRFELSERWNGRNSSGYSVRYLLPTDRSLTIKHLSPGKYSWRLLQKFKPVSSPKCFEITDRPLRIRPPIPRATMADK